MRRDHSDASTAHSIRVQSIETPPELIDNRRFDSIPIRKPKSDTSKWVLSAIGMRNDNKICENKRMQTYIIRETFSIFRWRASPTRNTHHPSCASAELYAAASEHPPSSIGIVITSTTRMLCRRNIPHPITQCQAIFYMFNIIYMIIMAVYIRGIT